MLEPSREEAIFCDAVEVPIRERLEFLQKACAGDRELLISVERLLLIHDTEDDFLATPAIGLTPDEINEQPGDVIGCYQLEQKIGEGGFGVVWQADQLEPVKRTVALKIVKLGMDSETIVRRFDEERQTLAIMNHPNIATVLDAGTTTAGRPFFAMELVEGQSLDEFCLENDLSLSQQLGIFITVCRAVQHAHQKGIVHRDLKPSNILISSDDSDIIPKVIDFGIAKAIRDKGVIDAASDGPPIGTPQYMSPEQFSNESDVDTRSDIYSLGVILYRLLTGCGPDEDYLLNEQPLLPPPQKRLLNVNGFRPVATGDLNPAMQVEKELDWIAQKALSKDREDRYQSASEFAMDVERYMQCQPVSAGPSSAFYHVKKFFQRNKLLVGSAFAVLLATVVAALALTFGLLHANHQRKIANQQKWVAQQERQEAERQKTIAEDEAEEARLVAGVLKKMVSGANPSTSNPSDYSLREHLDEVTESLDQLADHPEVEAELRTTAAKAYHNLSQMHKAEIQYKRALDLRLSTLGEDHA